MHNFSFIYQAFEAEENYNVSADLEPAISIDHANRLHDNINTMREIFGVTNMVPMASGTVVNRYHTTVTKGAKQPGEGEIIPLSKVEKKPLTPLTLELDPVRRLTSAQAIQKKGRAIAIDECDGALVASKRGEIIDKFFTMVNGGQGVAEAGAGLQASCAKAWSAVKTYFDDTDATPIFFVNTSDIGDYMADHTITLENEFGFSYLKNFLGLGTVIASPKVTAHKVFATAVENINGVYVPANGDVAAAFDMAFDESNLVGITHGRDLSTAGIETLILMGVLFYLEDESGIFVSNITQG